MYQWGMVFFCFLVQRRYNALDGKEGHHIVPKGDFLDNHLDPAVRDQDIGDYDLWRLAFSYPLTLGRVFDTFPAQALNKYLLGHLKHNESELIYCARVLALYA